MYVAAKCIGSPVSPAWGLNENVFRPRDSLTLFNTSMFAHR
jgi:hypothetical protein